MEFTMTKKEKIIYKNAGGGEAGKSAVLARREYLQDYKDQMSEELREWSRLKYLPRNEKNYINPATIQDNYD